MASTTGKQVYVYYGPEDFAKKEALDLLKASVGLPEVLDANTTTLKAQGLTLQQLRDVCSAVPFLADRRLVIVEGLMASLEEPQGQRPPRARSARGQKSGAEQWDALPDAVKGLPPTTILVFLDQELRRPPPLLKELAGVAEVRNFLPPKDEALRDWIRGKAAAQGAKMTPAAVNALADLVGGNLWALQGEIEKLSLYAAGREIQPADVEDIVPDAREASIFQAVDAVLAGQAGRALHLVEGLRQGGAEASYMFTMLARQLRLVLVAQELMAARVPREEMRGRLGLSSDYVFRVVEGQARRCRPAQLEEMLRHILRADESIKTGKLEEALALETLVAEMAQQAARR
ncbi:MAG: DNA polymerase III subunit delta [Chloroflexi bacterium]|nr:DNA polymerase III subunit delta [Chloroflexota bacterium]